METSVFIAKIIGVIYFSFGIGLIFSRNYYKKELPKLLKNNSFLIFGGFIAIIIGFFIIENHNYWVKNWNVIITIIGWIALFKGVILIAFPTVANFYKPLFESHLFYKILGFAIFIFGALFLFLGFFNKLSF
jgi:hypothetical protein